MVKIGDVDIRGSLVLAPMAGVTDAPFRALCRAQGAALTCTEMVSAKALVCCKACRFLETSVSKVMPYCSSSETSQ